MSHVTEVKLFFLHSGSRVDYSEINSRFQGKRSVADQMYEAARYIKYLEKKIKELEAKKDELKRRHGSSNDQTDQPIECSATIDQEDTVMVNLCGSTGVEVAINCNVDQGLPLGRVLEVLIGEGLSISSCNTTRVNRRLLHSIQCEVLQCIIL